MLPAPAYLGRKARERMVTLPTRGSDRQREIEPKKKKGSSIRTMKKA